MNTVTLKELNISKIIDFLRSAPSSTVAEISRNTLLSIATCSNIMNQLFEDDEVIESGLDRKSGGRPAKKYSINPDYFHICCLQLYSQDRKDYMVYFTSNRIGENLKISEPLQTEVTVDSLVKVISELVEDDPLIKSIGIGVPGLVYQGRVGADCDNPSLRNTDLLQELSASFDLEFVIENDMNLRAIGSYYLNYDSETDSSILTVVNFPDNDCIGAGTAVNGRLMRGMSSFSGELSYLPLSGIDENRHLVPDTSNEFTNIVLKIVLVIITTFNPSLLILTGSLLTEEVYLEAIELCAKQIPAEHLPQFILKEDTLDAYRIGLLNRTIKSAERQAEWVEIS